MTWILITLFAVVMQSVRTAGQKALSSHLDAMSVTFVRFLFGLPFAALYLVLLTRGSNAELPGLHGYFWTWVLIAGCAQIVATVLLVQLFALRNFAVGTTYARTEAFLTALLGASFFAEHISTYGWIAIVLSVAGVVVLTVARSDIRAGHWLNLLVSRAALIGLASGLAFAIASLGLRTASLSLGHESYLISGATTLVCMVTLQTVLMLPWMVYKLRHAFAIFKTKLSVCLFVGVTSAAGSAGWFTAMTLERASYVKALGQIEFVLSLLISTLFFKEHSNRLELFGMFLIAIGVVCLVVYG